MPNLKSLLIQTACGLTRAASTAPQSTYSNSACAAAPWTSAAQVGGAAPAVGRGGGSDFLTK